MNPDMIYCYGNVFERNFDMQQPNSNEHGTNASPNQRVPVEKSYIRPVQKRPTHGAVTKSGGISFQAVLLVLTAALTVSLLILIALLVSLRIKTSQLEALNSVYASENEANKEKLESMEALATVVEPIEEPETYATYTEDTKLLTDIRSEFAILIDVQKNEVIAHRNGDAIMYPASMTKVMTLIVGYENIQDLNETFTFDYTITDPAYIAGASIAGFAAGETVPFIDILYGIALPSGADATTAVAVHVAGSEEAFAELMNEKAQAMGLENTHFVNASGLHDNNHYSTAHDIAKILEYAMNIPLLAEILSTYKYTTTPTEKHPEGILLVSTMFTRMRGDESEVAEVIAGKTGYTHEASNCLASCAETPDGNRYILVTGKAAALANEGQYGAVFDAIKIYKEYIPQS